MRPEIATLNFVNDTEQIRNPVMDMVKNTILLLVLSVGLNAAPDDIILSQAKNPGPGNIQRNLAPVANAAIGVDANKVPVALNAFTQNSATGAVTIAAQGTNQNVTIQPSDSGSQGPVSTRASYSGQTIIGTGGLQIVKQSASGGVFPSLEILAYRNGFTAQSFIVMASANGTEASPTTNPAGTTVGGFRFYGRANSLWKNIGNVSTETSATFSDSDFSSVLRMGPSSATAQTTLLSQYGRTFTTIVGNGTTDNNGLLTLQTSSGKTQNAFGVSGPLLQVSATTITDSSSSGTVATAVANSFAVPTFAASSATTFTNAANLYIAGDVSAGTNVTLTNSYGLWNAGKSRFDGAVTLPSTNTAGLQLYNTVDQVTNYQRLVAKYASNFASLGTDTGTTASPTPLNLYAQGANAAGAYSRLDVAIAGAPFIRQGIYTTATGTTKLAFATPGMLNQFGDMTSNAIAGSITVFAITPTYNQASGTASNTDFLINRTQTAVGSGAQLLIDAQVGGTSQFSVSNNGRISVKQASNGSAGTFTLSSGSATVNNTSVTADSVIVFTIKTSSGTPGATRVSATSVGTSFTITGAAGDNSTYNYIILNATP